MLEFNRVSVRHFQERGDMGSHAPLCAGEKISPPIVTGANLSRSFSELAKDIAQNAAACATKRIIRARSQGSLL